MPTLSLPFAHLNLRHNPFGELTEGERAAVAVVDLDAIAARLRTPGHVVQFVGGRGRGKTTHLLALKVRLPEARYVRMPAPVPDAPILLIDEADRVPGGVASYALGVHSPLAGCDDTIVVGGLTAERLARIIGKRIELARRGPGPVPRVAPERLQELVARHGDDLRAIEDELYEEFQCRSAI